MGRPRSPSIDLKHVNSNLDDACSAQQGGKAGFKICKNAIWFLERFAKLALQPTFRTQLLATTQREWCHREFF